MRLPNEISFAKHHFDQILWSYKEVLFLLLSDLAVPQPPDHTNLPHLPIYARQIRIVIPCLASKRNATNRFTFCVALIPVLVHRK